MIDYYNLFKTAASSLGCAFILGDKQQVELYTSLVDISLTNGLIMLAPVEPQQTYNGGLIEFTSYNCTVGLGRFGILSDSYEEKYNVQLREMELLMESFFKLIGGCSTSLSVKSSSILSEINRFSDNLDCIYGKISFTDE